VVIKNAFSDEIINQIKEIIEPYLKEIKENSDAKYYPDWRDNVSTESLLSVIDFEIPKSKNNNLSRVSVDKPAKQIEKIMKDLFPDLHVACSGTFFYPDTGYMSWHTNHNHPTDRVYITYASEQGKSFFRYYKDGKVITDYDDKGITVRRFTATGTKPYFWHCVGSQCDRVSIGFQLAKLDVKDFRPMARYAIIEAEKVTDVVEWNGDTNVWSPPSGSTAVVAGDSVGVGDTYKDSNFTSTTVSSIGADAKWMALRKIRNDLLIETDWWGVSDRTMTDAQKKYRQDLRDLPESTSDPEEATWPVKPTS